MDAKKLISRCSGLKSNWSTRDKKIREWYDVLTLKDELAQEGMESVVSNDPRTGFNLGKHLMTSSIVAHKIEVEGLSPESIEATSYLEDYFDRRWSTEESRYRRIGKQGMKSQLVALMLATGWYSAFSMVDENRIWSEVYNPIEVYPEFGSDGLVEIAHIYNMKPAVANRKAKLMGWDIKYPFTHNTNLYNYWGFDDESDVVNGIVLGQQYVKPLQKDPALSKLGIIPIFISPVGGLPDTGAIRPKWQEHFGESIIATNEELAKNYNRMLTFSQQLMRDTANPRWFEQSSGDTPILREEDLFKRGAIFRGAPGENVGPLPVPPIPVELRQALFDYQNMLQRGLFPWAIFGNIQQQMSYLAMANIASAALQVLTPYMEAFRGVLSDIDNFQTRMIMENGFRPYGLKIPENLPREFEFNVQADIEIPGYLIQRATVSRMLNPNFRLPERWVIDKMFPEVKDPLRSQAMVRTEDAMMHPKAILVDSIIAYRKQARRFRNAKPPDIDSAKLYEKLATSLEAELAIPEQPRRGVAPEVVVPREVMPGEATEGLEGLVRR